MPGGVTLKLEGHERVRRALDRMRGAAARPRRILEDVGSRLEASTRDRFERGEGPDGKAWRPSVRAGRGGRRRGRTLIDSGRLRRSIVSRASESEVVVGTNLRYAAIHQFGGEVRARGAGRLRFFLPGVGWRSPRRVVVPARPFLGIDKADAGAIERIVGRHLDAAARGAPA